MAMRKILIILVLSVLSISLSAQSFYNLNIINSITFKDSTATNWYSGTLPNVPFVTNAIDDSLDNYARQTALEDTAAAIRGDVNLPSFGTDGQLPIVDVAGTDYVYSSNFKYDSTNNAFTVGYRSGTVGINSIVFGGDSESNNIASGVNSLAQGVNSTASGVSSKTFGSSLTSSGVLSTAIGSNLTSYDFLELVLGQYNIIGTGNQTSWVSTDNLFTIGNGIGSGTRNNAFQVKKDGTTYINDSTLTVTTDTTFNKGHLKVDSNLYVGGVQISPSTASNGITKVGNDFQLGGTLTANTDIWGDDGAYRFRARGTSKAELSSEQTIVADVREAGFRSDASTTSPSAVLETSYHYIAHSDFSRVSSKHNEFLVEVWDGTESVEANISFYNEGLYILTPHSTGKGAWYAADYSTNGKAIGGTGDRWIPDLAAVRNEIQDSSLAARDSVLFNATTRTSHAEGMLNYDTESKSLVFQNDISNFNHNIGYEHVVRVYNMTGSQIDNGRLVRIDSVKINGFITPSVQLAGIYSLDSISGVGMATVDIPNESYGIVTLFGEVKGLNTSAYNNADALYADTAGYIRNTKPDPPAYTLRIGYVEYADNDSGQVYMLPGEIGFSSSPNFSADTTRLSLAVTITTQNVFEYIPLSGAGVRKNFGYTVQGDSVQVNLAGDYDIDIGLSFQGNPSSETWRYGIFVNNIEQHTKSRTTASSANGDVDVSKEVRLSVGDWVSFRIANESGAGDPTMVDMSFELKWLNE